MLMLNIICVSTVMFCSLNVKYLRVTVLLMICAHFGTTVYGSRGLLKPEFRFALLIRLDRSVTFTFASARVTTSGIAVWFWSALWETKSTYSTWTTVTTTRSP